MTGAVTRSTQETYRYKKRNGHRRMLGFASVFSFHLKYILIEDGLVNSIAPPTRTSDFSLKSSIVEESRICLFPPKPPRIPAPLATRRRAPSRSTTTFGQRFDASKVSGVGTFRPPLRILRVVDRSLFRRFRAWSAISQACRRMCCTSAVRQEDGAAARVRHQSQQRQHVFLRHLRHGEEASATVVSEWTTATRLSQPGERRRSYPDVVCGGQRRLVFPSPVQPWEGRRRLHCRWTTAALLL